MPSALQSLVLNIAGTNTTFNLVQKGMNMPVLWTRQISATGALIGSESVGYTLKFTPTNGKAIVDTRIPVIQDVVVGSTTTPTVMRTAQAVTTLTFNKQSSTAERTRALDTQIAALTALRAGMIAAEDYF